MKRLTERDEQGNWSVKGLSWQQLYVGQVITKEVQEKLYGALCKLLDYEKTGLEPYEVEEMNNKVKQIPISEGDNSREKQEDKDMPEWKKRMMSTFLSGH